MAQTLADAVAAAKRAERAAIQRDREREAAERNGELSEVELAFAGRSLYGVSGSRLTRCPIKPKVQVLWNDAL